MQEPSDRNSRLAIAAALLAVIAVGGAGFLLGRTTAPRLAPVETPTPTPEAEPTQQAPRILGRADLIALANAAGDAFASGQPMPSSVSDAAGQRFELLLPFGCTGSDPESTAPMRWSHDPDRRTLRATVIPEAWSAADWGLEPATPPGTDGTARATTPPATAAEGFWITRPWSSGDICPPAFAGIPDPAVAPRQTLAIAHFIQGEADAATRRDRRPFETVQRMPVGTFDGSRGLRVRVTGRVSASPGSEAVLCLQSAGPEQRPVCAIAATLNEVSIENPVTGQTLATWPFARSPR